MTRSFFSKLDVLTITLYVALVFMGWINVFSSSLSSDIGFVMDLDRTYTRQLLYIGVSMFIVLLILLVDIKLFTGLAYTLYGLTILILIGLFFFGKKIAGTTAWYNIGGFGLQPSEFAKIATALAISKYIGGGIPVDLNARRHIFTLMVIIGIPMVFIALQPDMGTVLAFSSFFGVLFISGFNLLYLWGAFAITLVFILTLKLGVLNMLYLALFFLIVIYIANRKKGKRKRRSVLYTTLFGISAMLVIALSSSFIFNHIYKQHHRDRFELWLNLEKDKKNISRLNRTIGYNTHQSEAAISSGGFWGKGFLQGSRTKGNFVPEQHTDYIFTTVGEEWGLVGTFVVLAVYTGFLLRLLHLIKKQKTTFSKTYGYCVLIMFFMHYTINISMVIGLFPTVGIPLPFFSYGGSSMNAFTMLLFIFLKLDASRREEY